MIGPMEQHIDKKTKSRKVATNVSGSKEKFADLAVRSPCINYGENHQLDGCLKFMDMTLKDRINLLSKKKYCFRCLQPMNPKQNAKTCDQRCRTCSGAIQQPCMVMCQKGKTMLKMIKGAMSLSPIALLTLSTVEKHQTKVINMCIVPVNDVKNVLTYAMLDNCSQGSLIQEALVKKMQTSGRKTTLNLKILNSERSESTTAIEGLQVARSKDGSTWIKMPRIYTREHLAVNKSKVATL